MIGCQAPMWVMADTYMAGIEQSMGAQYASELARYMPSWMGIVAIAIIFVGALLGSLLGHKMLKKHFERAGHCVMEKYAAYQPPKRKGFYLDPRTKILFMAFCNNADVLCI